MSNIKEILDKNVIKVFFELGDPDIITSTFFNSMENHYEYNEKEVSSDWIDGFMAAVNYLKAELEELEKNGKDDITLIDYDAIDLDDVVEKDEI